MLRKSKVPDNDSEKEKKKNKITKKGLTEPRFKRAINGRKELGR